MSQGMDLSTMHKIDNATVIKHLTSTASIFADAGVLTPSDADNLRLSLNSLQFNDQKAQSVLTQLIAQNSEFLCLLKSHFGSVGLCLNIYRYTVANALNETVAALGEFGEGLLTKAQVLFNRPLFIYLGGQMEKRTLYSSLLVDLAEIVYSACEEVQQAQDQLRVLMPIDHPSAKGEVYELDKRIAKELGFRSICFDSIPYKTENQTKRKIVHAIASIVEAVQETLEQVHLNRPQNDASKATVVCENLDAACQVLAAFHFPKTDNIELWEGRRLSFLGSLLQLNQQLRQLSTQYLELIGKATQVEGASKNAVSKDMVRSVTSNMILDGIPALRANAAACALVRYCEQLKISPNEIIVGELHKIDPHLTVSSLELFKELANDNTLVKTASEEKKRNLDRRDHLLKLFHQKLVQLGVLGASVLAAFIFTGCGVKLAPKSAVVDYRPAPHYRSKKPELPPGVKEGTPLPPPPAVDATEEPENKASDNVQY